MAGRMRLPGAALLCAGTLAAQPAERFVLGEGENPWRSGGNGVDPTVLVKRFATGTREDTTNVPGAAIDFDDRPGWISTLRFDPSEVISARALETGASIKARNAFMGSDLLNQLRGTVNGDHRVAFERKPTRFNPNVNPQNVWVELDFGIPVGIHRIRFYPRNTVVETPATPFHDDYTRGYEVWVNAAGTADNNPDVLIERRVTNDEPVVDIELKPQYAQLVKVRNLASVPYEIDEIEVYGTGYLKKGTYLTDILDLGGEATIGPIAWAEESVGDPLFSARSVRVRTGTDLTPILYRQIVRDGDGRFMRYEETTPQIYYHGLDEHLRAPLAEDIGPGRWSPWQPVRNGELITAPNPRRFVQLRVEFEGGMFQTRQLDRLAFDYLSPPIAGDLVAEVYPRLAEPEEPATFRYAVLLRSEGQVRGFDRLEIDTNVEAGNIRQMKIDGEPVAFEVEYSDSEGFAVAFPLVMRDGSTLEFTFDLPVFRFGTTFSGRAFNRSSGNLPQRLRPGNAVRFDPGDIDELSGLFVAIPEKRIGELVGRIHLDCPLITPNGDGINDEFLMRFNLLQLTSPAPVTLELFDLSGRRVTTAFRLELGVGKVAESWDGRDDRGRLVAPGLYVWVLTVHADAVAEKHRGLAGVVH